MKFYLNESIKNYALFIFYFSVVLEVNKKYAYKLNQDTNKKIYYKNCFKKVYPLSKSISIVL